MFTHMPEYFEGNEPPFTVTERHLALIREQVGENLDGRELTYEQVALEVQAMPLFAELTDDQREFLIQTFLADEERAALAAAEFDADTKDQA